MADKTKEIRKIVYNKYSGRCAYCGCEIDIRDMHIDHLKPIYRNDTDEQLSRMNIVRGSSDIENLMPACPSCNLYKSTLTLEKFRHELEQLRARLNERSAIYRISLRYNLIEEKQNNIIFYFEK